MLGDFLKGAQYLLKGLRLLTTPGVRRFVIIPLIISAVVLSGGVWLTGHWVGGLVDRLSAPMPAWLDWLRYLLWPLFALMALLVIYFGFTLLANFVAAPFNGWLAEAVEISLTGSARTLKSGWRELPAEMASAVTSELRKLGYFALWAIPLIIALFIPVIGPMLWFLFGGWAFACNYADFPMGNHGIKFREQRRLLASRRALSLGFGMSSVLMTFIPLINFFAIPAAVAGMTALYLNELRNPAPDIKQHS